MHLHNSFIFAMHLHNSFIFNMHLCNSFIFAMNHWNSCIFATHLINPSIFNMHLHNSFILACLQSVHLWNSCMLELDADTEDGNAEDADSKLGQPLQPTTSVQNGDCNSLDQFRSTITQACSLQRRYPSLPKAATLQLILV
jgi:hypothetical protein